MDKQIRNQTPEPEQAVRIAEISLEHHREPLGIGESNPRISWIVQADPQNWLQVAYEIEITRLDGISSTGKFQSSESVLRPWPFSPLESREVVQLRIRVWGEDGSRSGWSEPLEAEAGLLKAEDWQAGFVGSNWPEDLSKAEPVPYLRHSFEVRGEIKKARLYASALGVYEAYLNGVAVGDQVMAPGWTSYPHRLRYQTFDVTHLLRLGSNAIGALLGDGWYRGRLGFWGGRRNIYGDKTALLAQLEIEYADGSTQVVTTDNNWKAHPSPVLKSDIYDGEIYDARLELPGWALAGFDDSSWSTVVPVNHDFSTLIAPVGPPVRRIQTVGAVELFRSPSGKTLVDFGQNLVGRLRIRVQGAAGHCITFKHAEVLERGELGIRPLRVAEATDHYTLKGDGLEFWEPRFTFHGFRFVQVDNWPGELCLEDLEALVIHSDMERRGWFECSNPLVNQLHQNVVWSMRGNFLDIPTDCPQRDERLGWTGDIQVFTPTANFLFDSAGFLASWLADLAAEQDAQGVVPFVVPNILWDGHTPAAAWGDAATIVPWVLYNRYGDLEILQTQYTSMKAWVDCLEHLAGSSRLWDQGFQFGDWVDPDAPPDKPGQAKTHSSLVATAYFARSTEILAKSASLLGYAEDAQKYHQLHQAISEAFAREFVTPSGRMVSDAPTAYALAIAFDLLPNEAQRDRAGERLLALVRQSGFHISTGFVGTPLMCDALCATGATQAAFRLLTQTTCPSWLYPVTMGATTIWERWDSMLPDGSINPGEMTSFNHYALGAVADWMHRTVAGLVPLEPGYRRLEIAPQIGGGLTHAKARHKTPYGMAEVSWKLEAGRLELSATIPANTRAHIHLPGSQEALEVGSGSYCWELPFNEAAQSIPFGLESPLADIVDSSQAFGIVNQVIQSHAPQSAPYWEATLKGSLAQPLSEAVGSLPEPETLRSKLADALAQTRSPLVS